MNEIVTSFIASGVLAGSLAGAILLGFLSAFFSIGTPLAVVISWRRYRSIFWTTVLGMFGWVYVLYYYFALQSKE